MKAVIWLTEAKCKKIQLDRIIDLCCDRGIALQRCLIGVHEVVCVDEFAELLNASVLLQKTTDLFWPVVHGDVDARRRLIALFELSKRLEKAGASLIDPILSAAILSDRLIFNSVIQEILLSRNDSQFGIPDFAMFDSQSFSNTEAVSSFLYDHSLKFPLVLKPIQACGAGSHQMCVVFNVASLVRAGASNSPCLIQNYIPHGDSLFKLFVIGPKRWCIIERSTLSVPDDADTPPIEFVSGKVSSKAPKTQSQDCRASSSASYQPPLCSEGMMEFLKDRGVMITDEDVSQSCGSASAFLDRRSIQGLVDGLSNEMGLTLFGVDLIVPMRGRRSGCTDAPPGGPPSCTNSIFIIDVNYFPGYQGIPFFHEMLVQHMCEVRAADTSSFRSPAAAASSSTHSPSLCNIVSSSSPSSFVPSHQFKSDPRTPGVASLLRNGGIDNHKTVQNGVISADGFNVNLEISTGTTKSRGKIPENRKCAVVNDEDSSSVRIDLDQSAWITADPTSTNHRSSVSSNRRVRSALVNHVLDSLLPYQSKSVTLVDELLSRAEDNLKWGRNSNSTPEEVTPSYSGGSKPVSTSANISEDLSTAEPEECFDNQKTVTSFDAMLFPEAISKSSSVGLSPDTFTDSTAAQESAFRMTDSCTSQTFSDAGFVSGSESKSSSKDNSAQLLVAPVRKICKSDPGSVPTAPKVLSKPRVPSAKFQQATAKVCNPAKSISEPTRHRAKVTQKTGKHGASPDRKPVVLAPPPPPPPTLLAQSASHVPFETLSSEEGYMSGENSDCSVSFVLSSSVFQREGSAE